MSLQSECHVVSAYNKATHVTSFEGWHVALNEHLRPMTRHKRLNYMQAWHVAPTCSTARLRARNNIQLLHSMITLFTNACNSCQSGIEFPEKMDTFFVVATPVTFLRGGTRLQHAYHHRMSFLSEWHVAPIYIPPPSNQSQSIFMTAALDILSSAFLNCK